jgi:nucleoside-diphosphate-sugar epimerase
MKRITITGGSGFVGRMLREGLSGSEYEVAIFDRFQGPWIDAIRHRTFGRLHGFAGRAAGKIFRRVQAKAEQVLVSAGAIRPTLDEIGSARDLLIERFRGSDVVIHLAALPHPSVPGMTEADYRRINYEGSVNILEAARAAGVRKFIFASSGQVYAINKPVRIDQFPILESNYLPTLADGVNLYGFLKGEFERYACAHSVDNGMQTVALRLEFPGVLSRYAWNLYICCSIENTVAGFKLAIERELSTGFDVFNLADSEVRLDIANIQEFVKQNWPGIPNRVTGNGCLLGTEKAQALLGYNPRPGGTYYSLGVMW